MKPDYSSEDNANFDRLMDFPDSPSRSPDDTSDKSIDTGLTYSESDNQAFEQLMGESALAKLSGGGSDGNSFLAGGYLDSDSSQFDELESVIDDLNILSPEGFVPSDQNTIEYNPADKQVFSRLMAEGLGVDDGEADKLERTDLPAESSHIKIIDFDKEHAREKSRSRQGQNHIKIRYFD